MREEIQALVGKAERYLRSAQMRHTGDYEALSGISEKDVEALQDEASQFLEQARSLLREQLGL